MKVITEDTVKQLIDEGNMVVKGKLRLPADSVITPAAMDVITNARLQVEVRETCPHGNKPEHMTHLNKDTLVCKDDPRIAFRGEVDVLIAEILKVQLRASALGIAHLLTDLEDVHGFVCRLSSSEVKDEPFEATQLLGMDLDMIHDISHHPKRHFGRGHLFMISYEDGELTVLLNGLRALSRQCELAFYRAFKKEDGTTFREDLMRGYNRLSSALYVLCLRAVCGQYEAPA